MQEILFITICKSFKKSVYFQLSDREAIQKNIQGKLLFPNITTLSLDMNKLTHLPDDIKEMQTLKCLSVKQNLHLREVWTSVRMFRCL